MTEPYPEPLRLWHALQSRLPSQQDLDEHELPILKSREPGMKELSLTSVDCLRIMSFIKAIITHIAPIFIITSPITSYADQVWNISRTRSSAGFSLDIPLIMLVASILKTFYWLGARFDTPLLIQALLMIAIQLLLLHVALLHRPPIGAQKPFAAHLPTGDAGSTTRPFAFWQWRSRRPYFHFLAYFTLTLLTLQLLLSPTHPPQAYTTLQGYVALSIEALLPLPQILENQRSRSCRGFRLSVLANWLVGDAFKMTYFFLAGGEAVPWAFKACGLFQAACDAYLGVQYWMFGEGEGGGEMVGEKDGMRLA